MQRQLVGEVATLGDLDRVDLADEVGDRGVRGGQLLAEAVGAVHPLDRRVLALLGDEVAGVAADTGLYGSSLISEPATIGIHSSSRSVSDRMMRVLAWPRSPRKMMSCPASRAFSSCGQDGVLVAEHAVDERLAGADPGGGVAPHLLLDRDWTPSPSRAAGPALPVENSWAETTDFG